MLQEQERGDRRWRRGRWQCGRQGVSAGAGARVHLAGRTPATLAVVADSIRADGGSAETALVDALDEAAVDAFTTRIAATAGSLDISFNLIGVDDVQGTPLAEMTLADFEQPILKSVRSTFITARAAARQMIPHGPGSSRPSAVAAIATPSATDSIGGFVVALGAVDICVASSRPSSEGRNPGVDLETGGVLETVPVDARGVGRSRS